MNDCSNVTMSNTQSLWVIRNRDTKQYWNGLGFDNSLQGARTWSTQELAESAVNIWSPFACDILELRLIERESDERI